MFFQADECTVRTPSSPIMFGGKLKQEQCFQYSEILHCNLFWQANTYDSKWSVRQTGWGVCPERNIAMPPNQTEQDLSRVWRGKENEMVPVSVTGLG